ncbi:hypothetical protein MRX96_045311 [Rhipicephalus microplus]
MAFEPRGIRTAGSIGSPLKTTVVVGTDRPLKIVQTHTNARALRKGSSARGFTIMSVLSLDDHHLFVRDDCKQRTLRPTHDRKNGRACRGGRVNGAALCRDERLLCGSSGLVSKHTRRRFVLSCDAFGLEGVRLCTTPVPSSRERKKKKI